MSTAQPSNLSIRQRYPTAHQHHIFGIGLGRTCTRSLNAALCRLGYHSCHQPNFNSNDPYQKTLQFYDGATDSSVALHFKKLYEIWPESKFILTVRDKEAWLKSCKRHFKPIQNDQALPLIKAKFNLRMKLYGAPSYNRSIWISSAMKHFSAVMQFFSGTKEMRSRLLIMDIASGDDGWFELCQFLNFPMNVPEALSALSRFPKITTRSEFLETMEFTDKDRRVGIIYILKGKHNKQWIRRRCVLMDKIFYIYRRPDTALCDFEDCYNVENIKVGEIKYNIQPNQTKQQFHDLRKIPKVCSTLSKLFRIMPNKKPCTSFLIGLDNLKVLESWMESLSTS
jgi:hypothetical protein